MEAALTIIRTPSNSRRSAPGGWPLQPQSAARPQTAHSNALFVEPTCSARAKSGGFDVSDAPAQFKSQLEAGSPWSDSRGAKTEACDTCLHSQ